jgi:hypothetical protein
MAKDMAESIVNQVTEVQSIISNDVVPELLTIRATRKAATIWGNCDMPSQDTPLRFETAYKLYPTKMGRVVASVGRGMYDVAVTPPSLAGVMADNALAGICNISSAYGSSVFRFNSRQESYCVHLQTSVELAGCTSVIQQAASNTGAGCVAAACEQHRREVKAAILQMMDLYAGNQKSPQFVFEGVGLK